ncbi:MAG: hypothetical protein EON94_11650 [Caulobacteraceae bacterium]|nr:MAG: hypothetical protein EON94_11650 [Caulobacteraceae bacterium]
MKSLALAAVVSLLPAIALAQTAPREVSIPSGGAVCARAMAGSRETTAARARDFMGRLSETGPIRA